MPDADATIRYLAFHIKELETRLRRLETSPRAFKTSVRDGWLRFFPADDDDSIPWLYIGNSTPSGGEAGSDVGMFVNDELAGETYIGTTEGIPRIYQFNSDRGIIALDVQQGQFVRPQFVAPWCPDPVNTVDANGRPSTTSSSYDILLRTWMPATGRNVGAQIYCALGAGVTSMDVRIQARKADTSDAFVTVVEQTGITSSSVAVVGNWEIPTDINSGAIVVGLLVELVVAARVAAGTGTVAVAPVIPAISVAA